MPVYKNKKNGKWFCKFYYRDLQGNLCQKKEGFQTKRAALEFEREFQRTSKNDCSMLFSKLVHLHLEDCQSRLKPTTMSNKIYVIKLKILPFFGNIILNDIHPGLIRTWQNQLISYRDKHNKPYSPTYLKTMNIQLSAIFNYAEKYYKLPENSVAICGSIGKSKASGVKRIRVHDLRHSHASLLIEQGFSPLLISERLGYENVQTTLQTHSHLYPNKHNEVAEKLQNLIK